jgi:hypothetical protein
VRTIRGLDVTPSPNRRVGQVSWVCGHEYNRLRTRG